MSERKYTDVHPIYNQAARPEVHTARFEAKISVKKRRLADELEAENLL